MAARARLAKPPGVIYKVGESQWGQPSGSFTRTTFESYGGQIMSMPMGQGQVQQIDDEVVKVSQRLAALVNDLKSRGVV